MPALRPLHIEVNVSIGLQGLIRWLPSPISGGRAIDLTPGVYIVHMRLQFFPFNTRLPPLLKLLCHPLVGSDDAGMILRQVDTEMLADEKDQPGESRLFRQ